MQVDIKGLKKFQKKIDDSSAKCNENLKKEVSRITENISSDAKMLSPVDMGYLREQIQTRVYEDDNGINGEVYNNAKYAAYVELGTGQIGEAAGLVREGIDLVYSQEPWYVPVEKVEGTKKPTYNGKVTIVYGKDGQEFYKTNGMRPQPYLYPAMKQNEEDIKENLKSSILLELK